MRKTVKKLNTRGVTLVELLIYLGLSMMIMVVLSELFGAILKESVKVQNYSATQSDGRYIINHLRTHINNASTVVVPANLGESSAEVQFTENSTTFRYYLFEDKLYFTDGTGDYLVSHLDSTLTGLAFTRTGNADGKPVIVFQFTSSNGTPGSGDYESQVFKGAGGLR